MARITNGNYYPQPEEFYLTHHNASQAKGSVCEVDHSTATSSSGYKPTTTKAVDANEVAGVFAVCTETVAANAKSYFVVKGHVQILVPNGTSAGDKFIIDNSGTLVAPSGSGAAMKVVAIACEANSSGSAALAWCNFDGESGFGTALHT